MVGQKPAASQKNSPAKTRRKSGGPSNADSDPSTSSPSQTAPEDLSASTSSQVPTNTAPSQPSTSTSLDSDSEGDKEIQEIKAERDTILEAIRAKPMTEDSMYIELRRNHRRHVEVLHAKIRKLEAKCQEEINEKDKEIERLWKMHHEEAERLLELNTQLNAEQEVLISNKQSHEQGDQYELDQLRQQLRDGRNGVPLDIQELQKLREQLNVAHVETAVLITGNREERQDELDLHKQLRKEIERVQKENARLRDRDQAHLGERQKLRARLGKALRQNEELIMSNVDHKQVEQVRRVELKRIRQELKEANERINILTSDNRDREQTHLDELKEVDDAYQEAHCQIEELKTQKDEIEKLCLDVDEEHQKARDENKRLVAEKAGLVEDLEELQGRLAESNSEKEAFKAQIEEITQTKDSLLASLKEIVNKQCAETAEMKRLVDHYEGK